MTTSGAMFTIGHSTHPREKFVSLLKRYGISVVVDVRSSPFSRFNPQFNRDPLGQGLKEKGIKYVFMGEELGARATDPACYINGRVKYSLLAIRPEFQGGIARLMKGVEDHRIVLMCAEREPLECHRTLLVAQALAVQGLHVDHIHADGRLERHEEALERLVNVVGLPHDDLFRSKAESVTEALAKQEERIAYQEADLNYDKAGLR